MIRGFPDSLEMNTISDPRRHILYPFFLFKRGFKYLHRIFSIVRHSLQTRYSDSRIFLLVTPSCMHDGTQWFSQLSSPVTAAGPFRIHTGFPLWLILSICNFVQFIANPFNTVKKTMRKKLHFFVKELFQFRLSQKNFFHHHLRQIMIRILFDKFIRFHIVVLH